MVFDGAQLHVETCLDKDLCIHMSCCSLPEEGYHRISFLVHPQGQEDRCELWRNTMMLNLDPDLRWHSESGALENGVAENGGTSQNIASQADNHDYRQDNYPLQDAADDEQSCQPPVHAINHDYFSEARTISHPDMQYGNPLRDSSAGKHPGLLQSLCEDGHSHTVLAAGLELLDIASNSNKPARSEEAAGTSSQAPASKRHLLPDGVEWSYKVTAAAARQVR